MKIEVLVLMLVGVWALNEELPTYRVNLDDPPETRWLHIFPLYIEPLKEFFELSLLGRTRAEAKTLAFMIERAGIIDDDTKGELQSLAEATEVDYDIVLVSHFWYENVHRCLSTLVKQPDGSILHVRNMDGTHYPCYNQLASYVEFYRDDELVYKASMQIGTFVLHNAVKPGKYAVTLNHRDPRQSLLWTLAGGKEAASALRRAVETYDSFDDLVDYIHQEAWAQDGYFIISSADGRGVVLTTLNHGAVDTEPMTDWYLIQVLTDHWKPEQTPHGDRKKAVASGLEAYGEGHVGPEEAWMVFSTPPVIIDDTVWTSMMNAKHGWIHVKTRNNGLDSDDILP